MRAIAAKGRSYRFPGDRRRDRMVALECSVKDFRPHVREEEHIPD